MTRYRWPLAGLALVGLWFSLMLLPHFVPSVGEHVTALYYFLSMPVLLLVLLGWAVVALIRRRWTWLIPSVGGLVALPVTLLAGHVLARGLPAGSFTRPFDARAWAAADASALHIGDIPPRQKMLGDVVRRVLPGSTRTEIERQLGPSSDSGYFLESGRDLIYITGPERNLFSIDSEWLLIWVDDDGRFERYAVVTD